LKQIFYILTVLLHIYNWPLMHFFGGNAFLKMAKKGQNM